MSMVGEQLLTSAGEPAPAPLPAASCAELTFAIPFYSGRHYLQRAIGSVLRQRHASWRIIISDDGPEPGVESLVSAFRDPRLTYYRNEMNLGMVGNWNRCLDLASTDLVTLLHADDELLDGYTGVMLRAAEANRDAVAFFCPAVIINEMNQRRFSFPDWVKRWLRPASREAVVLGGEPALRAILRGNFIVCPTLCYRKSLLGDRRFAPHWKFVQDLQLTTRLLMEGETLVGLPQAAYAYRRHGDNATVRYTENLLRFAEEVQLCHQIAAESRRLGWGDAARAAERKTIIKLNLAYCVLADLGRLQFRRAGAKLALLRQLCRGHGTGAAEAIQ